MHSTIRAPRHKYDQRPRASSQLSRHGQAETAHIQITLISLLLLHLA